MNLVHSKDIFAITRDVLKLLDPRVINHGIRTSYILYKMLQCDGKYEMFELAEFAYIATIHDIGSFKTDYMKDALSYETKDSMPHSIYGYLFLLYLTPFKDRAKILLYHHTDYNQLPDKNYEFVDVINCLRVAEQMDIYSNILGEKFDYMMFQKQAGGKLSGRALELLYQAEKKFDIFRKLSTGEYKQELNELFDYLVLTNEEKKDCIVGLMYCVSFRSEFTMLDMVTCTNICMQIGEKLLLEPQDMELLYYASVLHDAGMCAISKEISEAPRKLTDEEMGMLRTHVDTIEDILRGRFDQQVVDIAIAHHERGDGNGYPKHLKEHQMSRLMRILQVADTVTGLTNPRSYRDPKPKNVVVDILEDEASKGRLSKEVVRMFAKYYDPMMESVHVKNEETLSTYNKLKENYQATLRAMNK